MDGRRGQLTHPQLQDADRWAAADRERAQAVALARGRVTQWSFVAAGLAAAATVLAFATGEPWLRTAAVFLCVGVSVGSSLVYRAATGDAPPAIWNGPVTLWAIPLVVELIAAVLLVRPAVEATGSSSPAWIIAGIVAASCVLYGMLSGRVISRRLVASS